MRASAVNVFSQPSKSPLVLATVKAAEAYRLALALAGTG